MLIVWGGLLAVTLLAGPAAAQSCRPLPIGAGGKNLALGKPASQSSIHHHDIIGSADKAVDGNCNGDWYNKSCTHTKNEMNPWWFVDLEESQRIYAVLVKNRDGCCGQRLYKAEVRLGDSLKDHGRTNYLCGIILNAGLGSITTIYCNGHKGRYVSVHLPGKDYLTLCEVEVYSTK
uniref:Fucolectin-5 n=1 Tax=Hypsiglena sp. JMG-2014 TaxID=1550645 RepID=A0A098LYP9_9SAUR